MKFYKLYPSKCCLNSPLGEIVTASIRSNMSKTSFISSILIDIAEITYFFEFLNPLKTFSKGSATATSNSCLFLKEICLQISLR